ncbi:hypothetical protein HC891_22715 [Candidatus Gracilibacteria bacterium]|nr:hypothetical protein [Candidatus Gracilibacteria bacterium]
MKLLLMTYRQMIAALVVLTLMLAVVVMPVFPASAQAGTVVYTVTAGITRTTVATNQQTGTTQVRQTNTKTGATKTVTTDSSGNSTTSCTDANGNSVPCP